MLTFVRRSELEVMQQTGLTTARERGAVMGNFTPAMGPASLKGLGWLNSPRHLGGHYCGARAT